MEIYIASHEGSKPYIFSKWKKKEYNFDTYDGCLLRKKDWKTIEKHLYEARPFFDFRIIA